MCSKFFSSRLQYRSILTTVFFALLTSVSVYAQNQNEDVLVKDVEFIYDPLYFPGGVALAGFEFVADSGVTLNGTYDIGCTVCLGALAFNFDDSTIMNEMTGDGLWMWDNWYLSGTCIIGTITMDLPVGTSGKVYFPVVATEPNAPGTPYYSANLVNVNLQPHPHDPSYDANDNTFGYTHTVPVANCVDELFLSSELPSDTVSVNIKVKSDLVIDQTNPVAFLAGNEVHLAPGFEVKIGNEFLADIEPCSP